MSRSKSAEEVRTGYIEKMGQELGEFFHATSSELTWTHWRWKQYRILFGDKPSRIDLLKEAAPLFFRIVHDVFFKDTLLAIARLVERPKSSGKRVLTVKRFPPLLADPNLKEQVCTLIEKAKTSAGFAVDWRNRRLAHRDLDLILSESPEPLPPATREKVEESLSALRDVLNRIEVVYCKATTAYDFSSAPGDAEALLYVIRDGLLREKDRQARWARRELHDDDLKTPEAV
jgi:hypothetical protein